MRRRLPLGDWASEAVVTPDGNTVISCAGLVWDVQSGTVQHSFRRYWSPQAISLAGKLLAGPHSTREENGWAVRVCRLASRRTHCRVPWTGYCPTEIRFSSDGQLIGIAGSNADSDNETDECADGSVLSRCRVKVFDFISGISVERVYRSRSSEVHLASHPDHRLVVVVDGGEQIWDAESGDIVVSTEGAEARVDRFGHYCVDLSPCGRMLAVGTYDGFVSVFDVDSARLIWRRQSHYGWIRNVVFVPCSDSIASAGDDHAIRFWNARTGEHLRTLGVEHHCVEAVAFSSDGNDVTAIYEDRSARVWSLSTALLGREEFDNPGILKAGAPVNPDTARNLWCDAETRFPTRERWDGGSLAQQELYVLCPGQTRRTETGSFADRESAGWLPSGTPMHGFSRIQAISPDGSLCAMRDREHRLTVWDAETGSARCKVQGTSCYDKSLVFSPDNSFLAMITDDNVIRVYSALTGEALATLTYDAEESWGTGEIAFSADSKTLVSGNIDYPVVLWDVGTWKLRQEFDAHRDGVCALALSPDGDTLAVGTSYEERVYMKSLGRRRKGRFLRGHSAAIRSVQYSPDGTRLATGAADGTVRIWDAETTELLATMLAFGPGEWVIYTPEGYYTGSPDVERHMVYRDGTDLIPASEIAGTHRSEARVRAAIGALSDQSSA